jgi:hypothetical protein
MPDGEVPLPDPTTGSGTREDSKFTKEEEERKKQEEEFKKTEEKRKNGEIGSTIGLGSSSGTDDKAGQYLFVNPAELNGIIDKWATEGDSIRQDGFNFQGGTLISSPTRDVVTTEYFTMLSQAFSEFTNHNHRMFEYNLSFVNKLLASHRAMVHLEHRNANTYHAGW